MKFQIFKDGKLVDNFDLRGAYMFGTDGIAIRKAEITSKKGIIDCQKPNAEAGGLALLWSIDGFGEILLPTTCLPERDNPYILNVEIARAKLMQIMNKREDWSFFGNIGELSKDADEAQNLFIQAVKKISDPVEASKLADGALKKAIVFSEQLAVKQAQTLFNTRGRSKGFGRGCLGCRINPKLVNNPQYVKGITDIFGYVTIPINWSEIEPAKGEYNFSELDACIAILLKRKLALGAGPLLCFSKDTLPSWLLEFDNFGKIRDAAYTFVSEVVSRYSSHIRVWNVVKGLNVFNHFGFSFEQVLEMTRASCMAVRSNSDRSLKIIEICDLWGEYYANTQDTIPPLVYMDMVVQSGINFDSFGLQMHFGADQQGMHMRDMMQISALLDQFAPMAIPISLTNVEVPSLPCDPDQSHCGGIWHNMWNETLQAKWIEQFYKIALSKPFVDTVTYSNFTDTKNTPIIASGLLTEQLKPKKSFEVFKKLHNLVFGK